MPVISKLNLFLISFYVFYKIYFLGADPSYPEGSYGNYRKSYRDNYRKSYREPYPEHNYRGYDKENEDINILNSNMNKNTDQVSNMLEAEATLRSILALLNLNFQSNNGDNLRG
jgi:hypothetical protein